MMSSLRPMQRVLIISVLVLLIACGSGGEDTSTLPAEYLSYLQKGKESLSRGDEVEAEEYFEKALDTYPGGTEAEYGLAISKGLKAFNLLGMISSIPFWFSPPFVASGSENDVIENMLVEIFSGINELHEETVEIVNRLLEKDSPVFEIDSLPVFIWSRKVLDLGGRWKKPDLYLFVTYFDTVNFLASFLLSQSLKADYLGTISFARNYIYSGLDGKTLGRIYAYLFIHNPDFLSLHSSVKWDDSYRWLTQLFVNLDRFLREGKEGGVLRLEDDNLLLGKRITDDGAEDLSIGLTPSFPLAVSHFVDHFTGRREILGWKDDMVPVLSWGVSIVLRLLPLEFLRDQIPEEYTGLLETVEPAVIEALLNSFIPDTFAMSPAQFFYHPVGLRELFPYWHDELPEDRSQPYWEWECQERDQDGFPLGPLGVICNGDDSFVDDDHFMETVWSIERDYYEGKFPYLVFRDPTFNGLLFLNFSGFETCNVQVPQFVLGDGYVAPDLRRLNLWFEIFYDCVEKIVESF